MNVKSHFSGMTAFALLITDDERLMVWGEDSYGCLGLGTGVTYSHVDKPTELVLPGKENSTGTERVLPVALACGIHHTLVLTEDQRLLTWGRNHMAQLGLGEVAIGGVWAKPVQIDQFWPEDQKIQHLFCG
jgi:alpha-tubulin suppressor-like RCC1 family protein